MPGSSITLLGSTPERRSETGPEISGHAPRGQRYHIPDPSLRDKIVSPAEISDLGLPSFPTDDDLPQGMHEITHPETGEFIFMGARDGNPLDGVSGLIARWSSKAVEPHSISAVERVEEFGLVDHAMAPASMSLQVEIAKAIKEGGYHPAEEWVNSGPVTIWERVIDDKPNKRHPLGRLVLRSIIGGTEVHSEDSVGMIVTPQVSRRASGLQGAVEDDSYKIEAGFLDYTATQRNVANIEGLESMAMNLEKMFAHAVDHPERSKAAQFITLLAEQLLHPEKKVDKRVANFYRYIEEHKGSIAEPTRTILRAYFRLQQLDQMQQRRIRVEGENGRKQTIKNPNYRPNAKKTIRAEKQRVFYGLAHMFRYIGVIDELRATQEKIVEHTKKDARASESDAAHLEVIQDPVRFEFLVYDELDTLIIERAQNAIDTARDPDNVRVLEELLTHLNATKRRGKYRVQNFEVRGHNTTEVVGFDQPPPLNHINLFNDLDSSNAKSTPVDSFIGDTNKWLGVSKDNYHADEYAASILGETTRGNLVRGVIAAFQRSGWEERTQAESDGTTANLPVYVAISGPKLPKVVYDATIGKVLEAGDFATQQRTLEELLSGKVDFASLIEKSRVERQVTRVKHHRAPSGTADGSRLMVPSGASQVGEPLSSGEAVALIEKPHPKRPKEKHARYFRGRIGKRGQSSGKSTVIGPQKQRKIPLVRYDKDPRYTSRRDGREVNPYSETGTDQRLLDVRFTANRLLVADRPGDDTIAMLVAPPFRFRRSGKLAKKAKG